MSRHRAFKGHIEDEMDGLYDDDGYDDGYYYEDPEYDLTGCDDQELLEPVIMRLSTMAEHEYYQGDLVAALRAADYDVTNASIILFETYPGDLAEGRWPETKATPAKPVAKPTKKATQPTKPSANKSASAASVASASKSQHAPKPKSSGLSSDVIDKSRASAAAALAHVTATAAEEKPRLNLVVAGHVDAGKSTIMGRLLFELGHVSAHVMKKFQQEADAAGKGSFAYAWVLDENEAERERGVTVDVGQKHFDTDAFQFTLLDAPGHKDFVPNMISGAAQADVAILVVNAAVGEYETGLIGQTKEHALLLRSLGVTQLLVVLNKMDTIDWDQSRFEHIVADQTQFLTSLNFKPQKIRFVPVSGLHGINLRSRDQAEAAKLQEWYRGPTLYSALDSFKPPTRQTDRPLRVMVTDVYQSTEIGRGGQRVAGRVNTGVLTTKHAVILMPGRVSVGIKFIERRGERVEYAVAGDLVEIGVGGVDSAAMHPGQVMCAPHDLVPLVKRFRAQIVTNSSLPLPLVKGLHCQLHLQTLEEPCVVSRLERVLATDGSTERLKPRALGPDTTAVVRIRLSRKIAVEPFADNKFLGRFLLRYSGETIAAGLIQELL